MVTLELLSVIEYSTLLAQILADAIPETTHSEYTDTFLCVCYCVWCIMKSVNPFLTVSLLGGVLREWKEHGWGAGKLTLYVLHFPPSILVSRNTIL